MYVKEMHIEVRQGLQKIASNRTRKLLDQEIDWLLNKNYERYVRTKVTPRKDGKGGFEILQDDLDAIRVLVKRGVTIPAFINDSRTVRCPLPGDYAYLTQDESLVKRLGEISRPTNATTTTNAVRHMLVIPLRKSTATTSPYYKQVTVALDGNTAFDLGQYAIARDAASYNGFSTADEVFALPPYLLKGLIDGGWDAYWEYYNGKSFPKSLIIITGAAISGSITVDGLVTAGVANTMNVQILDAPGLKAQYQANRLTASNVVSSLLEVSFYGTQSEFPISELVDKSLYVYTNRTFIVSNAVISYVRKPQRISLILGTDCELSDSSHQLICDLTVEYVKAMIGDPNWEVKLKDDMTRTTLS